MIINTNSMFSMTQANRNFSQVAEAPKSTAKL